MAMKKSPKKKMVVGGPFKEQRRHILTKRINKLEEKGMENLQPWVGNKEKAYKQFAKADKLQERRATIRKKGGAVTSRKRK
jgi:hypothetical protein